jgi:arylsulfatase A-like enzyme
VLKSLRQFDNTMIVFTSEHGCHFKTRNDEYKRSDHEVWIWGADRVSWGPFTGGGCECLPFLIDNAVLWRLG